MKNNLKILLLQKDKQAKELAEYIGVNKVIMSYITNGVLMPTVDMANKIVEFLNCSITDIWNTKQITYLKPNLSPEIIFCDKQQGNTLLNQNKVGYNLFNSQINNNLKVFTAKKGQEFYKPTRRLNKEGYDLIKPEKLKELGFADGQHWVNWMLNNFELWCDRKELEKRQALILNLPANQTTKGVNYGN